MTKECFGEESKQIHTQCKDGARNEPIEIFPQQILIIETLKEESQKAKCLRQLLPEPQDWQENHSYSQLYQEETRKIIETSQRYKTCDTFRIQT